MLEHNFLIFSLPLKKKDLQSLTHAGVYFFIKYAREHVCQIIQQNGNDEFLNQCSILYIGKAKKVKQRSLNYNIFSNTRKNKLPVSTQLESSDKSSKQSN